MSVMILSRPLDFIVNAWYGFGIILGSGVQHDCIGTRTRLARLNHKRTDGKSDLSRKIGFEGRSIDTFDALSSEDQNFPLVPLDKIALVCDEVI
jgi:hypothetical protein